MREIPRKRLEAQILKHLANLTLNDLENPKLGIFTLTKAELADDLSLITVSVSVFGSEDDRKESLAALRSSASYLRGRIGKVLTVHNIPKIRFIEDETAAKQEKIDGLLDGG